MRFSLIILLMLLFRTSYAQTDSPNHFPPKSPAIVWAHIDHLNERAAALYLSSPDSALKLAETALLLAEKNNYPLGKGRSFLNIGHVYWSQSYYPVSLFYLNSALTYLPKSEPLDLADCYRAIGRTYADLKNYKLALNNLRRALHFAGSDVATKAEVYSERSYVYCALKNYNQAIADAKFALHLNKSLGYKSNISILYGRLGTIYTSKRDYSVALAYDNAAYNMSIAMNNKRLRAKTLAEYALINNELGRPSVAVGYAQRAITLADSSGFADIRTKAYKALVNSFERKNDLKQALAYQRKYNAIQDSLITDGKLKSAQLIQNYFSLNSRLNSISLMELKDRDNKAKIRSQQTLILVLVLSMGILIILLSATFYLYKHKQMLGNKLQLQHKALLDQKQLIEAQAVNLQAVNDLKDRLLTVIGHDLTTPVANLSNIVELFETKHLTNAEVHGLMKNINPIVKGAELTLSNLLAWAGNHIKGRNINSSNVDIFLLGVEMEQTFIHPLQLKNIEFINRAFPGQAVLADENHIKVILRNLISNAIKFTAENGSITLTTIIENNGLVISVKDNGKGMTPDEMTKLFYISTHFSHSGTSGEKGAGIGLLLCKELVELNGGKLGVKSTVGEGSTFYFNLPLIKAYA
jgi:signal transduction histidine kinase